MTLDVETPPPPELDQTKNVADAESSEYRREELEEFLHEDGAWERAFGEWCEHTDLDERDWQVVVDLGLLQQFDFFWDDFVDRVGYHAPGIPEDWREREIHPELDSWDTVSGINAAMAELGDVVSKVLGEEYIDWSTDDDVGEDLPDYE